MDLAINIGDYFDSPFGQEKTLGDLVSTFLNVAFVGAGVLILFLIVFAGFQMVAGAGQNKPENAEKAKQAMTGAAIGFVVIFVAYWIIRIIELVAGVNFITEPAIF